MKDIFIKALLYKSKMRVISVFLITSTVLFANDLEKDMKIMQKAIIKLMDRYNNVNNALNIVNSKNKILEEKVIKLQTKLQEIQKQQEKIKEPKAEVGVFGVYASGLDNSKINHYKTKKKYLIAKVKAQTLNIRNKPTASGKHIRYLVYGDIVNIIKIVNNKSGYPWAKLKSGGYASIDWLEIEINKKD